MRESPSPPPCLPLLVRVLPYRAGGRLVATARPVLRVARGVTRASLFMPRPSLRPLRATGVRLIFPLFCRALPPPPRTGPTSGYPVRRPGGAPTPSLLRRSVTSLDTGANRRPQPIT